MGFSTFIEINNDFHEEIKEHKELFIKELLHFVRTGDRLDKLNPIGVIDMITLHRDDKKCRKIQELIKGAS